MLELSCADYTFPQMERRDALALLRLLQFDYVDIGLFERSTHFPPSELKTRPQQFMRDVLHDTQAASLRVADVFLQAGVEPSQLSANNPNKNVRLESRDHFQRALELCAAIQCGHMTGLPGVAHSNPSRDLALAIEEAAWRVEMASTAGIVYAVEPHIESVCESTKAAHAFVKAVPGLTLTLDYGHFIAAGESNDAVHVLLSYASHIHLRGAAPGKLQSPMTNSTVDLQHILDNAPSRASGMFALEYVWADWRGCNQTDNVSETILLRKQIQAMETKQKQ